MGDTTGVFCEKENTGVARGPRLPGTFRTHSVLTPYSVRAHLARNVLARKLFLAPNSPFVAFWRQSFPLVGLDLNLPALLQGSRGKGVRNLGNLEIVG